MSEDFRDEIYHKFMNLTRLTSNRTHEKLETVGLHRGQPVLLFNLWKKDGQSGRDLSQVMKVQPATVTKMVQRLRNNGFVVTSKDDHDSRVSRVFLTDKGKAIENDVRAIFQELHETVFEGLSQEQLDLLGDVLDTMKCNLSKMT